MSDIYKRIKRYRNKRGLTQLDVATKLGIRVDNYSKYESGARIPRSDRLVKLAEIFDVSYNALSEGVEREFLDLLNSHAVGSVVGEPGSITMFVPDMDSIGEPYFIVAEFFNKWEHKFVTDQPEFYQKYLDRPNLAGLIALYDMCMDQCDTPLPEQDITLNYTHIPVNTLESTTTLKLAFCIAVKKYLEYTADNTILDETEKLAGDILKQLCPFQFFAVKVFVPYISFIVDAVKLCMNTTIDDFELAFLFYALTPPDDDDESDDGAEDD